MFCLLVIASAVHADTITLRNGQQITGKIVGQTRTSVQVRTQSGQFRTLPKTSIRRIQYGDVPAPKPVARPQPKQPESPRRPKAEQPKTSVSEQSGGTRADAAPSGLGLLWRSALIPGWGFWSADRPATAIGVFSGFVALAALSASRSAARARAQSEYATQVNTSLLLSYQFSQTAGTSSAAGLHAALSAGQFDTFESANQQSNRARAALVAFYLGQLVHAYFFLPETGTPLMKNVSSPPSTLQFFGGVALEPLGPYSRSTPKGTLGVSFAF